MCRLRHRVANFTTSTAILATLLLVWCLPGPVFAQGEVPRVKGAAPTPLPFVPNRAPREDDNKFQPKKDEASVSSFIETVKGNDAAIQVTLGQGRLITTKQPISTERGTGLVSVADPSIVDFEILPNARMIRLIGKKAGITDLSITTGGDQTYSFEVHVVYDLDVLRAQLRHSFPDTELRLAQLRDHVVIEGQARSNDDVTKILSMTQAYLSALQETRETVRREAATVPPGTSPTASATGARSWPRVAGTAGLTPASPADAAGGLPKIINLLHVPGVNQVMLQVRIAELNRTAMREIGADLLGVNPKTGTILGTQMAGGTITALGTLGLGGLTGTATGAAGPPTTGFGIFPKGDFEILVRALRRNSLLSIMAEPNLVALNGHRASFLAGGQFPIPVPQSTGGTTNSITVEFKDFGVQLDFLPYILDGDTIRLSVTPEVSTIDFALGTTLVTGGTPVPGLNTRRTSTTVELAQGQTLAIAGLLQIEMQAQTDRIPGLGDLPYIGPFFSNTSHKKLEKELLVMVTPYLVKPMKANEVPCLPGANVTSPTDCEFYFKNRIEGRSGGNSTWDTAYPLKVQHLERTYVRGPVGFSN